VNFDCPTTVVFNNTLKMKFYLTIVVLLARLSLCWQPSNWFLPWNIYSCPRTPKALYCITKFNHLQSLCRTKKKPKTTAVSLHGRNAPPSSAKKVDSHHSWHTMHYKHIHYVHFWKQINSLKDHIFIMVWEARLRHLVKTLYNTRMLLHQQLN
jgi:hypothetical protein